MKAMDLDPGCLGHFSLCETCPLKSGAAKQSFRCTSMEERTEKSPLTKYIHFSLKNRQAPGSISPQQLLCKLLVHPLVRGGLLLQVPTSHI